MPSLREYVLTLKKYNPNAQDRLLKIYLLKAGWPISDIEKTFSELSAAPATLATPVSSVSDSVTAPISVSAPVVPAVIAPVIAPAPHEAEAHLPVTDIEISAIELPPVTIVSGPVPSAPPIASPLPEPASAPAPASQPAAPVIAPLPVSAPVVASEPSPAAVSVAVPEPSPAVAPVQAQAPVAEKTFHIDPLEARTFNSGDQIKTPVVSSIDILSNLASGAPGASGYVMPDIEKDLASPHGPGDLKASYASLMSRGIAPVPAASPVLPTVPVVPTEPPTPTPILSADILSKPFSPSPIAPAQPAMSIEMPVSVTRGRHVAKIMTIWAIVIVLLGGLGLGYMRFVHGVYVFVSAPVGHGEVLAYLTDSIAKVDSASYSATVQVRMMPREPGVESLDIRALGFDLDPVSVTAAAASSSATTTIAAATSTVLATPSSADFLSAFPEDGILDMKIDGLYQREKRGNDGRWHFAGGYSGEGISTKIDLESIMKGGIGYVKAAAFPEMFFDINAVKDKWIAIEPSDTEAVQSALPWLSLFSAERKKESRPSVAGILPAAGSRPADFDRQAARLISIASEEKVLEVIGDPMKIIYPGAAWYSPRQVTYEYQVRVNPERAVAFLERAGVVLQSEFGSSSVLAMTDEQKAFVKSGEFLALLNYFARNGFVKIIMDKDKAPIGIDSSLKLVSDSRQALVSFKLLFNGINSSASIEAPKPEMNFTDAYVLISGQSKELLQLKAQVKTVEAVRAEIERYRQAHGGETPTTLAGITLPGLTFATSSYAYKKSSKTTYLLSYQIVLPPVPKQFYELPLSLIGFDSSTAASSGSDLSMQYLKFVNGKNTASEKALSMEGDASRRLDSDRDRIANSLEQYIGTNITKKDTDDDGVTDYDELKEGGNPLGAGGWLGSDAAAPVPEAKP